MPTNCTAVIIAAGKSSRMGKAKGLLNFDENYWILEQIHQLSKAGIKKVIIVLGYQQADYFKAIPWMKIALLKPYCFKKTMVTININPTPSLGSFSSLQKGLEQVDNIFSVLFCPVDIPLNALTIVQLLNNTNQATIPRYKNQKGHPILMDSLFWKSLCKLPPLHSQSRLDFQLKTLPENQISLIDINDENVLKNINHPRIWKDFLTQNKFK